MTIEAGLELSPQSRFTVHNNPDVAPGKCAVCSSVGGDDRQFIDFGMQLDWYGAVYFCTFCVRELAAAGGFVSVENYKKVLEQSQSLKSELSVVNESFRDYRDATRTMLRGCVCHDGSGPGGPVPVSPDVSKSGSSKSGTKEVDRKPN